MKIVEVPVEMEWQEWQSEARDLERVPLRASLRMLFELFVINAFERTVVRLKQHDCVHGPIHISLGQEAIAAAVLTALKRADRISGSHRAHHLFLAKVLGYFLPEAWNPLEEPLPEPAQEVVTRTLAEVMGLGLGYCGGRGGSMHLRHLEAGVLGTNAIVSGGLPLSAGAAFAELKSGRRNLVCAFFGDGGINQGSFHESANLAALWNLPIVYFVENNQYAVATPIRSACAVTALAQHAASYGMRARTVHGHDVVGLYLAMQDVAESIRAGGAPCLIDARCYRHLHHGGDQAGSAFGYRTKEEEADWRARDACRTFPRQLVEAGLASEADVERLRSLAERSVATALRHCTTEQGAKLVVRPELWPDPRTVVDGLRSDGAELTGLPYREREDFPAFRQVKYSDAIAQVTGRWLERDSSVVVIGEEVANFGGGAYGATKGLPDRFPDRVRNTPISECGFLGLGLGAAMSGMKMVVEIMFPDFSLVAADQAFNQIAKARYMYGGTTDIPLVVRTRVATGCGYGAQHSMDPVGLYALFAGWRIVAPSDSFDLIGLFNTAMHSLDPVLVLEHNGLYGREFSVPRDDLDYCIPFGRGRVVCQGSDITVLAYGSMVTRMLALADLLRQRGVSAEVIDLRSIDLPSIDWEAVGASLQKTGVVASVEEAAGGQAIGRRIASEITERFFDMLDGPPGVLTSMDIPNPVSRVLEKAALIDDAAILDSLAAMAQRRGCPGHATAGR